MRGYRSSLRSPMRTRSSGSSTTTGRDPRCGPPSCVARAREGGYDGVVAVEWGGSAWVDADDVDAFELVGDTTRCGRPPADAGRGRPR